MSGAKDKCEVLEPKARGDKFAPESPGLVEPQPSPPTLAEAEELLTHMQLVKTLKAGEKLALHPLRVHQESWLTWMWRGWAGANREHTYDFLAALFTRVFEAAKSQPHMADMLLGSVRECLPRLDVIGITYETDRLFHARLYTLKKITARQLEAAEALRAKQST